MCWATGTIQAQAGVRGRHAAAISQRRRAGLNCSVVDRVFGFDDLATAVRYVESDAHVGQVVVQM